MSDHGIHADEVLVWDVPQQRTYPTVLPTVHSESGVICNTPVHHSELEI